MKRHTTCGVWTPQVPIVAKCPLGAIIAQSIGFPCTHEECRLLRCHQATTTPAAGFTVHRVSPRWGSVAVTDGHALRMRGARLTPTRRVGSVPSWGQSPVGVSRRHKCARSTHAQPILPRWGQSRGVVSSGMGSVAVTNVHAQRMRGARPAPTRRVGSVPGWGQSPVGVSRRHKCARCGRAYFCHRLRGPRGLARRGDGQRETDAPTSDQVLTTPLMPTTS